MKDEAICKVRKSKDGPPLSHTESQILVEAHLVSLPVVLHYTLSSDRFALKSMR